MLTEKNQYLTAGIHIGMKTCTPYMKQFVYKVREDGLAVFNLKMVDERIGMAANFLSQFGNVLAISRKENAHKAVRAFSEAVNGRGVAGRFTPGTLTNPYYKGFFEPDVIIVVDPLVDTQVIKEAKKKRIPIVAMCDTFNIPKDVDFVIPINNNGRKSLSLAFWILAREILKKRGEIKKNEEFKPTLKDFGDDEEKEKPKTEEKEKPKSGLLEKVKGGK